MDVIKGSCVAAVLLGGVTLAAPASAWEPCMLTRSEHGGWTSNCSLNELFEHRLALQYSPRPCFLTNLELKDIEFYTIGNSVEILVEVVNRSQQPAPGHDLVVSYVASDAATGQWMDQGVFYPSSQGLAPQDRESHYVGTVYVPGATTRAQINVFAVVDPTSQERPGGEVWECNEMDNSQSVSCMWYAAGEEPGPNDPGPCH